MKVFIDSNIPMYVAGRAHPNRKPARRFLRKVRAGEIEGVSSVEVLQEILYRYCRLGHPDLARDVYDLFVEICPDILIVTLADTDRARDLIQRASGISTRDAVHAALMLSHGIDSIATVDAGFDSISGIKRWPMP